MKYNVILPRALDFSDGYVKFIVVALGNNMLTLHLSKDADIRCEGIAHQARIPLKMVLGGGRLYDTGQGSLEFRGVSATFSGVPAFALRKFRRILLREIPAILPETNTISIDKRSRYNIQALGKKWQPYLGEEKKAIRAKR